MPQLDVIGWTSILLAVSAAFSAVFWVLDFFKFKKWQDIGPLNREMSEETRKAIKDTLSKEEELRERRRKLVARGMWGL